jgi:integrase
MRAWTFQDPKQKAKLGDKCPWSVGWYDPQGKRRQKSVGSKTSADKYCRRVEGDLAAGLYADRKRVKWSEFRKQFAELVLQGKSGGTSDASVSALDAFERIAPPGYMDLVNTAMVDAFTAKRRKESACAPIRSKGDKRARPKTAELKPRNVSPATVNKELRHVRAALRKAWRWGMLPQPPEVTRLREPQRDPYFIDDADFAKLYDACDQMALPANQRYPAADWWRALLCFAYITGWRIGEILELRRENLDLESGIAKVDADNTKGRKDAAG